MAGKRWAFLKATEATLCENLNHDSLDDCDFSSPDVHRLADAISQQTRLWPVTGRFAFSFIWARLVGAADVDDFAEFYSQLDC